MKLESMKSGMVLHSYTRSRSVMRERTSLPVEGIAVDLVTRRVLARRNLNPAVWYAERHAIQWRREPYAKR